MHRLVVNGGTRNAQQTIYRLYFGAFETQCKLGYDYLILRGGGGGGCQILFGQIVYFRHGLGRGNLFSCGMGSGKFMFVYTW